jgi:hypothetical protein
MSRLLRFTKGNAKLGKGTHIFNLPAGHTCPFAKECLSKAHPLTGKIADGKHTKFRCFAASSESQYKNARTMRWDNFGLLHRKTSLDMANLISLSLPKGVKLLRIHESGDFFSQDYFDAWLSVASRNPHVLFYAYTKAIPFWLARLDNLPSNIRLTASLGGTHDDLAIKHNLKTSYVAFSEEAANIRGLEIDHNDSLAYGPNEKSFALLIHGTQPAGSEASKAKSLLRKKSGFTGYSRKAVTA